MPVRSAAERAVTLARRKESGMAAEQPMAIVLLSGGLDSSTALALAAEQGFALYALSFRYGQRHARELEASARLPRAQNRRHRPARLRRQRAHVRRDCRAARSL